MAAVELRHLRALIAIGEERNITRAAQRLYITQPALSRTLRQLEEQLGVLLVERSSRHLQLTPEGHQLWQDARTLLRQLDSALAQVAGKPRSIRVGYAWAALGERTVPVLRSWRREHPDVPAEIHRVDDPITSLTDGDIDIGLIRRPVRDRRIKLYPIYHEDRVTAVCDDHSLAHRDTVELAELARYPIAVNLTTGTTTVQLWPKNNRPSELIETHNLDEWVTIIATGAAIGISTASTGYTHPHPRLRYVRIVDAPPVTVYCAQPATPTHPSINTFLAHLETACRDPERKMSGGAATKSLSRSGNDDPSSYGSGPV